MDFWLLLAFSFLCKTHFLITLDQYINIITEHSVGTDHKTGEVNNHMLLGMTLRRKLLQVGISLSTENWGLKNTYLVMMEEKEMGR